MSDLPLIIAFFGIGFIFQSLFGFGAAFIIVLGLSLFMPIQPVIGLMAVGILLSNFTTVVGDHRKVRWRLILLTFMWSVPGLFLGSIILDRLPARVIVIAICVIILIYSVYSILIKTVAVPKRWITPLTIVSGFITGGTGLGVSFVPIMIGQFEDPVEFRVSLNLLWVLIGVFRIPIYMVQGIVVPEHFLIGLTLIPVMIVSKSVGRMLYNRMELGQFQRWVQIFLGLVVLVRLITEIL